jgi:DNA-binding MarR family transcriptional regulator
VAQLTLLEMQVLTALAEAGRPIAVGELAGLTEASLRQTGQATDRLHSLGLAERAGGSRGWERAFSIARGGRRLLGSLDAGRQAAVEGFIARLGTVERLRSRLPLTSWGVTSTDCPKECSPPESANRLRSLDRAWPKTG